MQITFPDQINETAQPQKHSAKIQIHPNLREGQRSKCHHDYQRPQEDFPASPSHYKREYDAKQRRSHYQHDPHVMIPFCRFRPALSHLEKTALRKKVDQTSDSDD
jgi:hypothetical protein